MSKGLLQVTGNIDVTQFWPQHESDGDTVNVMVDPDGFRFSPEGDPATFRTTHVFYEAIVLGGTGWEVPVSNNRIKVRLEHIDAPELHYLGTKNFRQYFGETAATKLRDLIASTGQQKVPCRVRTTIDHPNDAFDTYGRLIGSIIITLDNDEVNINHWMVQNGWALPSFYNSALPNEIQEISRYAEEAKSQQRGIWPHLSGDVEHPDLSLVFRPRGPENEAADIGRLVIPKIFRREVAWKKSGRNETFRHFLGKQKEDGWVKTADFLMNPAIEAANKNLSTLVDAQGMLQLDASDIVFFEKESTLACVMSESWWPDKKAAALAA